jgi:hypothetical protein
MCEIVDKLMMAFQKLFVRMYCFSLAQRSQRRPFPNVRNSLEEGVEESVSRLLKNLGQPGMSTESHGTRLDRYALLPNVDVRVPKQCKKRHDAVGVGRCWQSRCSSSSAAVPSGNEHHRDECAIPDMAAAALWRRQ